jgi:hypothetical protein
MRCRVCGRLIKPDKAVQDRLGKRLTATRREDLVYRCRCGASYSNAAKEEERVLIAASPEENVPKQVRSGLSEALAQALNRRNRRNKAFRFCSENSEDAVTWTVFRGLERAGRLDALVAPRRPGGEAALLVWGAPVAGARAPEVAQALARVCDSFGESENARTELDAIVSWPELTVLVEAKYRGENEQRPNDPSFERYLDRRHLYAAPPEEVAQAGYYELTRNWRLGNALAEALGARAFLLVNLGPAEKIETDAFAFSNLITRSPQREFTTLSWSDLLEAAAPLEPWLDRYASDRDRLLYWR